MRRWLLLVPVLSACAHGRAEVPWPAPDPRDRCFAGPAPLAALGSQKGPLTIEPQGAMTDQQIQRVFRTRLQDLKGCFAAAASRRPGLAGWVQLGFTVGADGAVVQARVERSGFQFPELESCVGANLCRWRFPAPTSAPVTVSYPLTFSSAAPRP